MNQEAKVITGIVFATLIILFVGVFLVTKTEEKKQEAATGSQNVLVKPYNHKVGSGSANIVMVEFADFQCPSCRNAHAIIKQIVETYKDKMTFVYRHFPLPQHKNAMVAARVSEAAGDQGKFWEMYDELFNNQAEWEESDKAEELFIVYAKKLKLDVNVFTEGIRSSKYDGNIQEDQQDGISLGVNSTPTLFLNGKKLTSYSYEYVKEEIEAALK